MSMKLNGNLYVALDRLNELECFIGLKKTGHILDTDRVSTHLLKLFSVSCKSFVGVEGRGCIGDRSLNVSALADSSLYCGLEISCIVESIEYTDYINTVCYRFLYKVFNDVVSIVTVTKNILTSEEHLKLGILNVISDCSESYPRILVEESKA